MDEKKSADKDFLLSEKLRKPHSLGKDSVLFENRFKIEKEIIENRIEMEKESRKRKERRR